MKIVHLCWVPEHQGNSDSEKADSSAQKGQRSACGISVQLVEFPRVLQETRHRFRLEINTFYSGKTLQDKIMKKKLIRGLQMGLTDGLISLGKPKIDSASSCPDHRTWSTPEELEYS